MINRYVICMLVLLTNVQLASAASYTLPDFFVSLDGAWLLSQPGKTQEINLFDDLGNTYRAYPYTANNNTLIVGAGFRIYKNEWLQSNLSLRYLPMTGMTIKGEVWQLNSREFNNLVYEYTLQSHIILVENIMTWSQHHVQPGIIFGLGNTTNITSDFNETAIYDHTVATEYFPGARNNQFTYEVGAALDYALSNMTLECAYRYINAGAGHLGLSSIQNTTDLLSTGQLHYHSLSLGVRIYYAL